jgi:polysaccharide biosynthesis/export protein
LFAFSFYGEILVLIARIRRVAWMLSVSICTYFLLAVPATFAQQASPAGSLLQLGPGDQVSLQVYGQADMTTTEYIADDGTLSIPLARPVKVSGMSPADAARAVEKALKEGGFLIDPHVTISVLQTRSQRVTILGEVGTPGRYPVEANTTILDLLAVAGGITADGSKTIYIVRVDTNGTATRIPVDLSGLEQQNAVVATNLLKSGDSILVPRAELVYVSGEVRTPNSYAIRSGMTVMQAIVLSGGITEKGSKRRIDIRRKMPDGSTVTQRAKLNDSVQADDVIVVKESIF